jgi:hypothetical protein
MLARLLRLFAAQILSFQLEWASVRSVKWATICEWATICATTMSGAGSKGDLRAQLI